MTLDVQISPAVAQVGACQGDHHNSRGEEQIEGRNAGIVQQRGRIKILERCEVFEKFKILAQCGYDRKDVGDEQDGDGQRPGAFVCSSLFTRTKQSGAGR